LWPDIAVLAGAAAFLILLLYFDRRGWTTLRLLAKTAASLLFVTAALIQPIQDQWYFHFLFIGLLLCLGGDVFLALPGDKMFLGGLVSFLTGHVFYILAFVYLGRLEALIGFYPLIILAAGAVVFMYLRPHLGTMLKPTLAYMLVISLMVWSAVGVMGTTDLRLWGRLMILVGAILFYVSDLFVARRQFVAPGHINHLIGLPLYYGAQFLFAFSLAFLWPQAPG
jgi:uncharacterized membrane protein YhhN